MPPKIRELIAALNRAGFSDRGGKGSHRNFIHPRTGAQVTLSGRSGGDAQAYQVRAVRNAVKEAQE
jgi:predicted RNA binding protein YcfA (HicA-like mRNA interferase family)